MQRNVDETRRMRALSRVACVPVLAMFLTGCSIMQIIDQSERIEAAGTLEGIVTVKQLSQRDVIVAMLRKDERAQVSVYRTVSPAQDGFFTMRAPAGDFYVAAFIDENHDGRFQPGEPGQLYGKPSLVTVPEKGKTIVKMVLTPTSKPAGAFLLTDGAQEPEVGGNIGVVTTIDDPRFDPDNGLLGMWRPVDFMAGPEGGLFMLQEYDPNRIPVLFVHGIGGSPRDFEQTIAGLNQERFQPWVAYYPSGLPLDMLSNVLTSAMHQMQRRYGFRQIAVIAHSMGGLVSLSYIQKTWERYPDESKALRLFVTVNSPLGGMSSAAVAVENSPVVIPSWQDVATGSEFLDRLGRTKWPSEVPYYLVFSFDGDSNGDGTVSLASQLPAAFQSQARRIIGFPDTHVGTLSDPNFIAELNRLLDASVAGSIGVAPRRQ